MQEIKSNSFLHSFCFCVVSILFLQLLNCSTTFMLNTVFIHLFDCETYLFMVLQKCCVLMC